MPSEKISNIIDHPGEISAKIGHDIKKSDNNGFKFLSDAQKAELLNVAVNLIKTPIILSPSKLINGANSLTIYTAIAVDPKQPVGSGQVVFDSSFVSISRPGVQVKFLRIKNAAMLVEFNVELMMDMTYHFRIIHSPGDSSHDISVEGSKKETLLALVPPFDGGNEISVSIEQLNSGNDSTPWVLYSVSVTTTG